MAYERVFGKPKGLEKRLAMWANQLSTDKTLPWVGLGLIHDLICASKMLGGEPEKTYPALAFDEGQAPKPAVVEYDL